MKVSGRVFFIVAAAASCANPAAALRGQGDSEVDIIRAETNQMDQQALLNIVRDLQANYQDLRSKYEDLATKHDNLQASHDEERRMRELPRSACNCASLTVKGDTHIGGATTIYGDTTLAGQFTTISGTSMSIQSKKTEIDGDMLTIQTSGANTRTGTSSAINVAGGAITAASLTVSGDTFLGGTTTIMGDTEISGSSTKIVGDQFSVKSKKTEIDCEMATIKSRSAANRNGEPATTSININGGSMGIMADSMMMRGFQYFTVNADHSKFTGEMSIEGSTSIAAEHFSVDGPKNGGSGLVSFSRKTATIVDGTVAFNNVTSIKDMRGKNVTVTESLMMCGMFEAGMPQCSRR